MSRPETCLADDVAVDQAAEITRAVPEYREFLTLEELQESSKALAHDFPGLVALEEVGRSAEGRPIELLRVGQGRRAALFVGAPHPNEPVGTLTIEFLSRLLCEREELRRQLGRAFLFVKVADPDGLALNSGWLKGGFDPITYALNYYRCGRSEQVEWGFPVRYRTLRFTPARPESRALMGVIDRYCPSFLHSLHNASFCGAYLYATRRAPGLFRAFRRVAAMLDLPLHLGEPELPSVKRWGRATFGLFDLRQLYDAMAGDGQGDPAARLACGNSVDGYLAGVVPRRLSIVSEVPYFTDPRLADRRPSAISRREAALASAATVESLMREVGQAFALVAPELPRERLFRSVEDYLERTPARLRALRVAADTPPFRRAATVAEAMDATVCRPFYSVLYLGTTYRMAVRAGRRRLATKLRRRVEAEIGCLRAACHLRVLPLGRLVALQAATSLVALGMRPGG